MSMTPRQKDVLDFVVDFQKEYGFSPTFREIGAGIGVKSVSRIAVLLNALQDRKYITYRSGGHRSIEILRTQPLNPKVAEPDL